MTLRTRCDAEGTRFAQPKMRSWYYFRITGHRVGDDVTFVIQGTSPLKIYQQGHKPVFRVDTTSSLNEWKRIPLDVHAQTELVLSQSTTSTSTKRRRTNQRFVIRFRHVFEFSETTYFAYSYPFSYSELQEKIKILSRKFENHPTIYFGHEVLVRSLDGRNLDLLTVSSHKFRLEDVEEEEEEGESGEVVISQSHQEDEEEVDENGLMLPPIHVVEKPFRLEEHERPGRDCIVLDADSLSQNPLRSQRFDWSKKSTYLLTSRIHCGETPASHMSNGFLDFILSEHNPRAAVLRDNFVFRIIPMLNPDGVSRGHWRYSSLGQELNGCFWRPQVEQQPTIFATRKLIDYLWAHENLLITVDLHAHLNKKNAFIFGNALKDRADQLECILYPKLVSLNCEMGVVDFERCNFARTRMNGFMGTERVVNYVVNGMTHAYTLEVNVNSGDKTKKTMVGDVQHEDVLYDLRHFHDVGRGLALALLDFKGLSSPEIPSLLSQTRFRNIRGVRRWISRQMDRDRRRVLWRGDLDQLIKYSREMLRLRLIDFVYQRGGSLGSPLSFPHLIQKVEDSGDHLFLLRMIARYLVQFRCNELRCKEMLCHVEQQLREKAAE